MLRFTEDNKLSMAHEIKTNSGDTCFGNQIQYGRKSYGD
jgi:hypothetical protein